MANRSNNYRPQTLAVHAGYDGDRDIAQPIHVSTTFKRQQPDVVGDYTRSGNPNRSALEQKIVALEGGTEAIAFSSGMAAINALFEVTLPPGSHVIFPDDCYHGTRSLLKNLATRKNITSTEVDMSNVAFIEAAIQPATRLIWMETPSNPRLKVTDIEAVARLAESKKIISACDSTFATPLIQKPFNHGADFVMHSSTKFFGGHSDILGGVIVARQPGDITTAVRQYQGVAGAVPSPFDCWLLYRSLSTFTLRVATQNDNAMKVANFLATSSKLESVLYPGLPQHPNHAVARRQMIGGFGSVMSVQVKGGQDKALKLASGLQLIKHATSLGGVETLIEHRRSAEGVMAISPDNLLRLSVGIEHPDDLLEDLDQALKKI